MTTRAELRETGETVRRRLFGGEDGDRAPEFVRDFNSEAVFGAIWARPGLAEQDRMICALTALSAVGRHGKLKHYVAAALDLGLEPRTILEVFLQVGLYGGFPLGEEAMETAGEVFGDRGIETPDQPTQAESLEELMERGVDLMRRLHGDRATKGYGSPDNTVAAALYPLAIQYGYGEIWFRPGLDERQRALVTVSAFTALKLDSQIVKFGQSALNMGLSRTQVIEAIAQTAPLSGFPPALNALALLSEHLTD